MEIESKFNKRSFLSVGLFISGAGLPFSGWMNHLLAFAPMSPERHVWMAVHNILGFLFMIFSILHVRLNWKILKKHFKKAAGMIITREAFYAVSLVVFLITIAVLHGTFMNR